MPQNVNFAVRGEVAQIFMTARGVKVATTSRQRALSTEAIAADGLKSTMFVHCFAEQGAAQTWPAAGMAIAGSG